MAINLDYICKISGVVLQGKKIGRKLGFPTANIPYQNRKNLTDGVYIASIVIEDNQKKEYPATVNIGVHPTFPEGKPSIEAYILDKNIDLYNKNITILFHSKIRDEFKFNNKEELIKRINKDVGLTKEWFNSKK
ncbi:MAG: hypothetical protein GYA87_01345 [Christensenellaceae bacterium]|nr:hypothetical protein [Christensenellaceae bacterium]